MALQVGERLDQELAAYQELEAALADPEISSDPVKLKDLSRKHAAEQPKITAIKEYKKLQSDLIGTESMLKDFSIDADMRSMAEEEKSAIQNRIKELEDQIEVLLLPRDPNEGKGVIFEIRAGTGGEEAALFAYDLFRMYLRFCEKRGLKAEVIDIAETGIGGLKEAVFSVEGSEAYLLLHQEAGTHRVQRIPVTESGGRIHTSAVTVAVLVEPEEEDITIEEKDLRVDTYRSSGAGGQHVNKTDSAVRITHIPTGLVVACQDERSQIKNRSKAMKVLRARLADLQESKRHTEFAAVKKEQVGSGDRSERIRTYNFPQGRVTDHRIGYTMHNLPALINGDVDDLLDALVQAERSSKMKKES